MFGRAFKLSGIPLCILTQCSSFRRNGNFSEGRGASLEITGGGRHRDCPLAVEDDFTESTSSLDTQARARARKMGREESKTTRTLFVFVVISS